MGETIYFIWMAFYSQFMFFDLLLRYFLDIETNGYVIDPMDATVWFSGLGTVHLWELVFLGISSEFVCWLFFYKTVDNKIEMPPLDSL